MKSNILPAVYFSMHANNGRRASGSLRSMVNDSPYLRAILSGKGGAAHHSKFADDDRQAAIRYIRESGRLKK